MFINDINPVLLSIGPLSVRYYGLVYALGFVLAYFFLRYYVKRKYIKMSEEQLDQYILWLIIALIIGSRLFEIIFYEPAYYFLNPLDMFMIWKGGMSFHGGLVGVIIVTYIFARKHKLQFYELADILVIPASIALFFGRIANFTNSELYGKITDPSSTPWCVVFQKVDSYCRHPSQLYEALKNLVIFSVLIALHKKHSKLEKGTLFWTFVTMYGLLRFITNFWRDDPLIFIGLSMGQILSLIMFVIGAIMLLRTNYKKRTR